MKIIRSFLTIFIASSTYAQSINVNPTNQPESSLNAEDLTVEVLIDGGACSSITNFQLKDNPSDQFPSANRSWGYFEKGNSAFPFEKGIVLTSGKAKGAQGPNSGIESYGGYNWQGDSDAEVLANYETNNATVFEFDFVPYGNEISFNYIFASEEYPMFSCNSSYNDVFGFIISGPGIVNDPGLNGKNIALLPNGEYVTINNVNDNYCGDDEFYVAGNFPYIGHGGRTTILTAFSEVIPGETYHIRLLVSDSGDYMYDSAVFLEAGSFNLGSTLVDLTGAEVGENQTVCGETEYTLVVNLEAPTVTYQWSFNGNEIPGATQGNYTATQSGYYSVEIISGGCNTIVGANIEFGVTPIANDTQDYICNDSGSNIFNLTNYEPQISPDLNVTFSYYQTLLGAETEDPNQLIPNINNFPVTNEAIIYVRINNQLDCYDIAMLTLNVGVGPETQTSTYEICDDNGDNFAEFDLTSYNNIIVTSAVAGLEFEYYTSQTDAENGTNPILNPTNYNNISNPQIVYVKTFSLNNGTPDCIKIEELTLKVNEFPEIQNWPMTFCDNLDDQSEFVDLTNNQIVVTNNIVTNLSYFPTLADLQNGTNQILNPNNYEILNSPTEIYVQVNSANGTCSDFSVLTINLNPSPVVQNTFLENCSIDGFSTYHLPDSISEIVPNTNGLTITFHNSYNNAFSGISPLNNDFTNTVQNQIIYVRIQNQNGCFSIAELTLTTGTVHETLNNQISICDDPYEIYDGIQTFDLTEMSAQVNNALGGTDYDLQYFTTLQNAQIGINPIQDPTNYNNASPNQTIYVRATGGNGGCAGTAQFNINVLEVPTIEIKEQITFCESQGSIDYEFQGEFQTIVWTDSEGIIISNSPLVTFQDEGIYTVEVMQVGMNCSAKRDIEVIFDVPPTISEIIINGTSITVAVNGGFPPYEYSYNNGLTWYDTNVIHNVPAGIHNLIVRSKHGCYSTEKIFGVLGIPNVITPNGDGYNDYFTIRGMELYPEARIKIFDRYGKVFMDRKINSQLTWDGKYQGRNVASGDYWYIITIDEKRTLTGHVSIRNK